MKKWDWRAELTPVEISDLEAIDAKLAKASIDSRRAKGQALIEIVATVRLLRSERLSIANRGTARARMRAGLANPGRKRKAAQQGAGHGTV